MSRSFVCGFSAEISQETEEKAKEHGLDDLLSKPISKALITEYIEKLRNK